MREQLESHAHPLRVDAVSDQHVEAVREIDDGISFPQPRVIAEMVDDVLPRNGARAPIARHAPIAHRPPLAIVAKTPRQARDRDIRRHSRDDRRHGGAVPKTVSDVEKLRVSSREHDATAKLGLRIVDTSVRQRDHRAGRESARGMGNAQGRVVNAPAESSRRKHRDEKT